MDWEDRGWFTVDSSIKTCHLNILGHGGKTRCCEVGVFVFVFCLFFSVHIIGAVFFIKLEFILLSFRNMCEVLKGPSILFTQKFS